MDLLNPSNPTDDALVVGIIFAHEATTDVVLGFIGPVRGHSPKDCAHAIAGVAVGALSFHVWMLEAATDKYQDLGVL